MHHCFLHHFIQFKLFSTSHRTHRAASVWSNKYKYTNFLLNQNNVDLKNNFLDLQTTDFNNSKISNYSLSKTETFSDVLASYSSKTSKEENYSSDISKNEAKVQYDENAGKDINEASKQSEIEKNDSVADEKSNSSVENVENKQTKSNDEVKNASETEKDSKKDKKGIDKTRKVC